MKTRTGFVSNSSSSSFIVFGAKMPIDDFVDTLQNKFNLTIDKETVLEQVYDSIDKWTFGADIANNELSKLVCGKDGDELYLGERRSLEDSCGLDGDEISAETIFDITNELAKYNLTPYIFGSSDY